MKGYAYCLCAYLQSLDGYNQHEREIEAKTSELPQVTECNNAYD